MSRELIDVPAGLRNVAVTRTTIGDVNGDAGFYHYREFSAIELAERCSLEEVWYLLFFGHLPDAAELSAFARRVAELRDIPPAVSSLLPDLVAAEAHDAGPLDGLRSALSLVASSAGFKPWLDINESARLEDALKLCAVAPTLLAAMFRLRHGHAPIAPDPALGHAANYLYMTTGVAAAADEVRAVEKYLVSTIDHGFNASTFAARVVAGTGADLGGCMVAAIAALSGPLHGGAPSRALDTLDAIGQPEHAAAWVREQVAAGQRMMGFGHAVYRTEDPRSAMLKRTAVELGGTRVNTAIAIEAEIVNTLAEVKPGRELHTNVEYFAGVVMERCGLDRDMFTPTFAASRVIGWAANILEQAADNKIIRPAARYVGTTPPQPVPALDARG